MRDALPLGQMDWQHAPLDPAFGHIQDGIEHGSHTQGARAATACGGGDHLCDPLPFLGGQVAWIWFFAVALKPRCEENRVIMGLYHLPSTQPAWTRRESGGAHENPETIIRP